ncbi:MAG: hemolysin family protein [Deltaproteobacteria bacterium]
MLFLTRPAPVKPGAGRGAIGSHVLGVPTWEWLAALVVVLGSAGASASETALTALGDLKARQLFEAGGKRARMLRLWVEHPERVLSSVLVTNTLLNVGGGVLAGEIAAGVAEAHGFSPAKALGVATALATVAILFAGEVVPKTLAKRHPIRFSLALIPFVRALCWVLWPVSLALVRATHALLRLFGGGKVAPGPAVTSEEIEYIIEMGTREGVLDEVKEELLNSVLEFADRVVKEIMVPRTRMVAIDRDAPPEEIVRIVTSNPYSRMPVYEGSADNILGILMVRDIVLEVIRGPAPIPWDRVLKPAFFVPEQMKVSRLLKEMQRRKTHLAVVVDEFGGTSGVVTLEDVLEEIVGEIQDEGDAEAAPVKTVEPGVWMADATVPLRELEEFLDRETGAEPGGRGTLRFPDEGDYETLGGFVTASTGRVPAVGAHVDLEGFRFTVRGADERRVTRVEIARREPIPAAVGSV